MSDGKPHIKKMFDFLWLYLCFKKETFQKNVLFLVPSFILSPHIVFHKKEAHTIITLTF